MDGSDERPPVDRAFRLLGDEMRLDILRAVWAFPADSVSFSEIRERIGNPNSGKFNYHLGELRGQFLAESGDGYRLTQAGREVVRAVLAGTITERPQLDPAPIDGDCVECGASLAVRYDEHAVVECTECGATVMWNEFPPAGLDGRAPADVATAFDRWTRHRFRLAMEGVCPSCASPTSTTVLEPGDHAGDGVSTEHRCRTCKYEARVPLFGHVTDHPAVVSFYHEAGVDVTDLPYWELQALAREYEEEVLADDPWTARITIESDDRRLRLVLDDSLDVVDVERSTR